MMIDVHCHIIHGVDDGPSSIEQSVQMLEEAEKIGIKVIIATPHYHESIFEAEKAEENVLELQYWAKLYKVELKIGYEVFINPIYSGIMKSRNRMILRKTRPLLMEFPFNARPVYCLETIKRLNLGNIIPVIAHPERNKSFFNNFGEFVGIIKAGCLIQVDAASIAGVYGKKIKEFTKKLVCMNLVDIVASNAHCWSDYSEWYMEAYNNVVQWSGNENARKLFYQNAKNLLDSTEVDIYKSVII